MVADMNIVSLTVPWTRDGFRGPPPSFSLINDMPQSERVSPWEEVRDERREKL